ncbi:BLUF domain-containing protein [Pseudovibrio sp. SPO723]|uniref:BLUF domain-containing protein n=1 Tax=Nesiotobacter zosterae TaxID=392721 RepID=UPI0029C263F4|nr:BLUF domain-containing protein [Pseudovibrio sp. SPO723]MDX5593625.1 BLUF domain-containing protein [Pseudovibrio sp. SPO723]
MSVSQLCYRSRIHWPALRHDLDTEMDLTLMRIRRINSRAGVTGALILTDTHVFQMLEGPWEAVKRTFECVLQDKRHSHLTVLHNGTQENKLFYGSWMQFFDLRSEDDSNAPDPFDDFSRNADRMHRDGVLELFQVLSLTLTERQLTNRLSLM